MKATTLQGKLAVNFYFDIVVQIVEVIAVAIEPDVTSPDTPGLDEFTLIGFYIMFIFADAKTGGVVNVVVEQSPNVILCSQ